METMEQLFCALKQSQARDVGGPKAILDMVHEWKGVGENLLKSLVDCFSDIESREQNLNLVRKSVERRLKDLEEKERKFDLFQEGKREELKLREEKLDEQLKLVHEHIESLEVSQSEVEGLRRLECEKLKKIEKREKEMDLIGGSLEKRLREVERREKEFDAFCSGKLRELGLKEELLSRKKKEFVEELKLANEELREKQKLGCGLIERLEMALNVLEGMKVILDQRFKEMESWETAAHESLTARLNEADLIGESLENRFKELEKIEKEFNLFQEDKIQKLESEERQLGTMRMEHLKEVKLREEKLREEKLTEQQKLRHQLLECPEEIVAKKLELKQGSVGSWKREPDYKEQHLEEHDCRGKSLSSVREFPQPCSKENPAVSELHQPQKYLVHNHAESIADKDQQPECRPRELELERNLNDVYFKEHGLKQSGLIDAFGSHSITGPDKSIELKHELQKDGKTLVMFINGTEKDLELTDDEIFKILLLSPDPAKLVLEAVEGFYTPHFRKDNMEFKVRKVGLLLLDQLTKMSVNIQPCVTEAALKLARIWKSKMSITAENPLEVLGFLHLLAAYNLSSYFDKVELFSFLKSVAQHKQVTELYRFLGLTDKIPDFIQNLINEKQYLLASTYIHECGLENVFPQAAVLDYYVKHSKLSAKAKCRRECNSFEAQDKAIAREIADLQVAIEHIIKYGLESDYSPDVLTARVKQLEKHRASLRYGISSSSAFTQEQGKSKRYWNANKRKVRGKHANKRKVQEKQHEEAKEAGTGLNAQMPQQGPESRFSRAWKAQNWRSKRDKHPATSPVGFHKPWGLVDEVPMTYPNRSRKRRRTNIQLHEGGLHLESMHHLQSPFEHPQ